MKGFRRSRIDEKLHQRVFSPGWMGVFYLFIYLFGFIRKISSIVPQKGELISVWRTRSLSLLASQRVWIWVWTFPSQNCDCKGILVKKRRMCFNLSRGSELTTLVKSTITTFQGPWPREGVTPDLIWASFMRTFLAPARWLNYQRVFLWEKSAGKNRVVYLSHCVEGEASVTSDEVGREGIGHAEGCVSASLRSLK